MAVFAQLLTGMSACKTSRVLQRDANGVGLVKASRRAGPSQLERGGTTKMARSRVCR